MELAGEPLDVRREAHRLERPADDREQLVRVERLLEVVVRALAHGGDRLALRSVRGHQDDPRLRRVAGARAELTQQPEAVEVGHAEIADHQIHAPLADPRERRAPAVRLDHLEPLVLENAPQREADALVVVHDQHASRRHDASPRTSCTIAATPPPSRGVSSRSPPCCRTSDRAIASPSPQPSARVVTPGSNTRSAMWGAKPRPSSSTRSCTPVPAAATSMTMR